MSAVRPVVGFPNYTVSEDGAVFRGGKRIKPAFDGKRYWRVALFGSDGRKYQSVHRTVAQAFVPNESMLPCVRHLDGDANNNSVSNLAWGTYKDNEADKLRHGTWQRRGNRSLTQADRDLAREMRQQGQTHAAIAAHIGVGRTCITSLLNGRTWRIE